MIHFTKAEPGAFRIAVMGRQLDPKDLGLNDQDKFIAFIHENIRKDLVFKKFTSELTYWK